MAAVLPPDGRLFLSLICVSALLINHTNMGCFNWVNTILGNLKTGIAGTCHAFYFEKYADRYLAKVQYCFNRRFDMRSLLSRLLYAAAHTEKRPEAWLRMAELPI